MMLDVYPDVFAWGVLLVPKDIKPGEKRPVVVCQHGRQRPAERRDRGRQPGVSRLRGPAGGARFHHLRAAQPLPRRGPLPDAQPQGQPAQAVDVLVHHRAAPADPELARHAAVRGRQAHRVLRPQLRRRDGRARAAAARRLLPVDLLRRLQRLGAQGRLDRQRLQLHVHRSSGRCPTSTWAARSTTRSWRT